jgi:hypothetical protein
VYERLDEAISDLRERIGGLPSPVEAEGIWTRINTLVMEQVELLLAQGGAVGNNELRDGSWCLRSGGPTSSYRSMRWRDAIGASSCCGRRSPADA